MNIGIEKDNKLIYEATSMHGYPIWPSPVMLQVAIASEDEDIFTAAKANDLAPNSLLFREETYNSSSRIRRGRLYKAGDTQPVEWHVFPHPAIAREILEAQVNGGRLRKSMFAFYSFRLRQHLDNLKVKRPVFILGAEGGFTIWTLVNTETSATGEEIVVLRARKSVGALPHLNVEKILAVDGKPVIDLIEKLEAELFNAGPESIVDRARDTATAILSKYLQSIDKVAPGKDLGDLVKIIAKEKLEIVESSAKIIARLHARGKHAEQERRAPRPITEQDAEYSVQAVGAILCDLGWAYW